MRYLITVALLLIATIVGANGESNATKSKITRVDILELQEMTVGPIKSPFLVIFHAGTTTRWAEHLHETLPVYQFVIGSFLDKIEAQIHNIKTLPSVKFFGERRQDIIVPKKQSQLENWVELQLAPIARLTDKTFMDYGNNDVAILLALNDDACTKFYQQTLNPDVRYACLSSTKFAIEGCDVALLGKFMRRPLCTDNMTLTDALPNAFPGVLTHDMLSHPLLHKLRPSNESFYVVSPVPPNVTGVNTTQSHIVWDSDNTMLQANTPVVVHQSTNGTFIAKLTTMEEMHDALRIVRQNATRVTDEKFAAALLSQNFSLLFDASWDGSYQMPKLPFVSNVTLSERFLEPTIKREVKESGFNRDDHFDTLRRYKDKHGVTDEVELSLDDDYRIASRYGVNLKRKKI